MNTKFKSSLSQHLSDFVKLRRVAGLDYSVQEDVLIRFDQYLFRTNHSGMLARELVAFFLEIELGGKSFDQKCRVYQVIRHFADYLSVYFPEQPRFPIDEYRRISKTPKPYLFTEDELKKILHESKFISRHNEIRNRTLYAALAVAIACGLRWTEIVNLGIQDVDLTEKRIAIRETKFGKSRIIPIGDDLCQVLFDYISFRKKKYPLVMTEKIFITMHKSGLSGSWLYQSFRELLCKLDLASPSGRTVHLHDLRHTFAVRTISAWYRSGKDVQALLPALATYMGHSHYSDTAYYLNMTAELLGFVLDKFDSIWKSEVTHEKD